MDDEIRTTRLQRIQELKEQLYNTQAEVIKTMEGYPVDDPDIMPKRQLWREQIATLEGMTDAEYEDYTEPEVETYVKDVPSADDIVSQLKELAQAQVEALTDDEAKKVPALFPLWETEKAYTVGDRVWYQASLYKCVQAHTSQSTWNPKDAVSLWANVSEESQEADGSREHPYAWESGMTSYNGNYYTENGILYLCIRDSGNPLYFPISSLIGTYFQIAE
jgi:hypothetical protein